MGQCMGLLQKDLWEMGKLPNGGGGGLEKAPPGPPPPDLPAAPPAGGKAKALLIGINYTGQRGQLRGCCHDVVTMRHFLSDHGLTAVSGGYEERILVDDAAGSNLQEVVNGLPTRQNIMEGMAWLVQDAVPGDTLFLSYSGHGSQVPDKNGDEEDGFDETLVPVDFKSAGQIVDDEIFSTLVAPLPAGVRLTAVMDCCHSGTVLDLPYAFVAGKKTLDSVFETPEGIASVLAPRLFKLMGLSKSGNPNSGSHRYEKVGNNTVAADVIMFSGCQDKQTSADVADVSKFGLPPRSGSKPGSAGGACINAMAAALNRNSNVSIVELLSEMRKDLERRGFTQVPQLSASRPVDLRLKFSLFGPLDTEEIISGAAGTEPAAVATSRGYAPPPSNPIEGSFNPANSAVLYSTPAPAPAPLYPDVASVSYQSYDDGDESYSYYDSYNESYVPVEQVETHVQYPQEDYRVPVEHEDDPNEPRPYVGADHSIYYA
eukprot:TRINITY_DN18535_c0_g1_i1.p1 TRINITY_DN18535_c0_g1~~TRINITY_DN18535_c0_g1_i1.p1  ORF type:complete len:486 (+),score=89.09 TRINITY_DN18535_c0_g1_i1:163-1620(+)